jgi:endonuclease YncB( thermonuclease family)
MKYNIIILFLLLIGCSSATEETSGGPALADEAEVTISYVIDGDTYIFYHNRAEYRIRLLGIDCFETFRGERLDGQAEKAGISPDSALALGLMQKHIADSILTGNTVIIRRSDTEPNRDAYDRLLRHVYMHDIHMKNYLDVSEFLPE